MRRQKKRPYHHTWQFRLKRKLRLQQLVKTKRQIRLRRVGRPRKAHYWPSVKVGTALTLLIALAGYIVNNHIEFEQMRIETAQAREWEMVETTVPPAPTLAPTPTATPSPTPEPKQLDVPPSRQMIVDEVKRVFGDDADKAFLLLAHENSSLNPNAVNTAGNSPKGSRDIGVFQINEYWQQVQGRYLFNWKINILIAKQIYDESGKTFKMWTQGRKLGI